MPVVYIFIEQKGDEPDVWDQCHLCDEEWNRLECLGNRCGAVNKYTEVAAQALLGLTVEG